MKKRSKKKTTLYKLSIILIILMIITILFSLSFFIYISYKAPSFNKDLLYKRESSNIYDYNGELITTIGSQKRQIVSYEELPEVLIDAIVATEDARFLNHKGLDIPRFLKASFSFISGNNIGGASTLTMQVSKNSFTNLTSKGLKGIIRKFTDIYMSIYKIEKNYSKEEIIEFYVNSPYLGAGSYGVQMASLNYFNKNIYDLNLIEAATIAGLFQSPGEDDPFVNPDKANERKNEVLSLMKRHGYINENEYLIAKNIHVKDILCDKKDNISPYQGYIDATIEEVISKTGNNPYEVSMDIYTSMIKDKQDIINEFYKTHKFKDNKVEVGIGVVDNKTGGVIALGAGRNKISERSFNYATDIKRHPGSTAKPLFDYGPGIEYLNWSTYTPFIDKPVSYTYGGIMKNVDNKYKGFLTLEQCLVKSRNTCALEAFKKINNSKINTFVTSLGITPEYLNKNSNYINEAHSIGGFTGVSPIELASAYSAFGNNGIYTPYHIVNKIVYKNNNKNDIVNYKYESKRVMKETTAYLISHILKKVTPSGVKVKGTDISSKTGTSSYDSKALKSLGLSNNVIQDAWTVTYSKDYSVAIWYGYDKLTKKTYNTSSHAWSERSKIQKKIVNKIMEKGSKFNMPSGIIASKVVVGTNPPLLPSSYTPSSKIQTHYFIKGYEPKQIINDMKENSVEEKGIIETLLP